MKEEMERWQQAGAEAFWRIEEELTMNEQDKMAEKLRDEFVKEATGGKPRKTVEQALQEALDNTTPEHAGTPDYDKEEKEEEEWGHGL